MPPCAGCNIEDLALWEARKLLDEKAGGRRIRSSQLLSQRGALDDNTRRPGDLGDGRVKLPQPELDTINAKLIKQRGQEALGHRFQQPGFVTGSKFDDTLRYCCVVDRVAKIVGASCRRESAIQFQIDGQQLWPSSFFGRDAAATTKLQLFDDDLLAHGGILGDRLLTCQARATAGSVSMRRQVPIDRTTRSSGSCRRCIQSCRPAEQYSTGDSQRHLSW